MIALMALVLVFGIAPVVGEVGHEFEASLLTAEEQARVETADPVQFQKTLLSALKSFVDDCDRFKMKGCVEQGNRLISAVASAGVNASKYVAAAEEFASDYEEKVALNACKYDLGKAFVQAKATQRVFNDFVDKYGDVLDVSLYSPSAESLDSVNSALEKLVQHCGNQLQ